MIALKLATDSAWSRCAWIFLLGCFGTLGAILLAIIVVDPYDGGRFPTFMPAGTSTDLPSTLNISRGRDPRFDAINLGDSRAVLIDPQHLSDGTGFRFVQLAVEGATIGDQLVYLHWFARHHRGIRAIAMVTELGWCDRNPDVGHSSDFPSALYSDSVGEYLRATLNTTSVRMMARRLSYALGRTHGIDPEHFIDFSTKYPWHFQDPPAWHRSQGPIGPLHDLPAMRLLEEALSRLPSQPPLVMWMPPRYIDWWPPPDSDEARALAECKANLRAWAGQRPRTTFLDFRADNAFAQARDNFLDFQHPSRPGSAVIEADIATAFVRLK